MKKDRNWWAIIWGIMLMIGIVGIPASCGIVRDKGGTWPEDYIGEIYLFFMILVGSVLMTLVGAIGLFLNLRSKRGNGELSEACESTSDDNHEQQSGL